MYLETLALMTCVAFLFLFTAMGMILSKRTGVVPLIISGLLLTFCGILILSEGLSYKTGENWIDTQTGNCSTYTTNQTLSTITYNSTSTYRYTILTGDWTKPTDDLTMLTLAYLGGGIFLVLWGAMNAFEKPEPET